VIPETAFIRGTAWTFSSETMAMIEQNMSRIASGVASGFGATAELEFGGDIGHKGCLGGMVDQRREQHTEIVGVDNVNREGGLVMGSEDFSFMLEGRPGAYIAVGNGGTPFCHNPSYDFNDAMLPLGASLYARLVERKLAPV
jgi:metal-dependent amidase/aminoacylase/carboxypeptidase family protein